MVGRWVGVGREGTPGWVSQGRSVRCWWCVGLVKVVWGGLLVVRSPEAGQVMLGQMRMYHVACCSPWHLPSCPCGLCSDACLRHVSLVSFSTKRLMRFEASNIR